MLFRSRNGMNRPHGDIGEERNLISFLSIYVIYPWDNACIESFHALLKREWINRFKIFNYAHAHKLIFEYIETFYNTVRIHSHCGYLSPNEYEEQYLENIEENAVKIAS